MTDKTKMGKVLQFRGAASSANSHVEAAWTEADAEMRAEKTAEMKAAFGPDDFSFSWLVVDDSTMHFGDDVYTFPLPLSGY